MKSKHREGRPAKETSLRTEITIFLKSGDVVHRTLPGKASKTRIRSILTETNFEHGPILHYEYSIIEE